MTNSLFAVRCNSQQLKMSEWRFQSRLKDTRVSLPSSSPAASRRLPPVPRTCRWVFFFFFPCTLPDVCASCWRVPFFAVQIAARECGCYPVGALAIQKKEAHKKKMKKTVALAERIIDDLGDFIQPTAEVKNGLPALSAHTFTHIQDVHFLIPFTAAWLSVTTIVF